MRSNHRQRVVSGVAYAGLMLLAAWLGPWTFLIAVIALLILALWETRGLFAGDAWGGQVLGTAALILSFACLAGLAFQQGRPYIVTLLLSAFIFDTAAYYGGKIVGGPKLIPRVSPNKTVAGLIAGGLGLWGFHLAVSALYAPYDPPFVPLASLRLGSWTADQVNAFVEGRILFVLILSALFLMGDLLVSVLKRRKGLKDTGAFIPGHGGILDRADSLLLIGPCLLIFPDLLSLTY